MTTIQWDDLLSHDDKPRSIWFTRDELLLIHWVLRIQKGDGPIQTNPMIDEWPVLTDLRDKVLDQLATFGDVCEFVIDDVETSFLKAHVPTTFRWGAGDDCGLSLLIKIRLWEKGEVDVGKPQGEEDGDAKPDEAKGTTEASDSSAT